MTLRFTQDTVDVGIVCSDFERSLEFYRDLLGLEVHADMQISERVAKGVDLAPTGFHHVRLRAGNTLIKLMDIENPPEARPQEFTNGVRWLTFFVEDVKGVYEELSAKGVPFTGPPIVPDDVKGLACAIDPDGILIEFVEL